MISLEKDSRVADALVLALRRPYEDLPLLCNRLLAGELEKVDVAGEVEKLQPPSLEELQLNPLSPALSSSELMLLS